MMFNPGSTVRLYLNGLPIPQVGIIHAIRPNEPFMCVIIQNTPTMINRNHIVMAVLLDSGESSDGTDVVGRIGV